MFSTKISALSSTLKTIQTKMSRKKLNLLVLKCLFVVLSVLIEKKTCYFSFPFARVSYVTLRYQLTTYVQLYIFASESASGCIYRHKIYIKNDFYCL